MDLGGCANGQVVLWDLEEYQDRLQLNKTTMKLHFQKINSRWWKGVFSVLIRPRSAPSSSWASSLVGVGSQ